MNPVAADDALRFLPGAVVNTAGQRGGLSSLFVRGGDSNYNKVIVDGVSVTEARAEPLTSAHFPRPKPIAWNFCAARRARSTAPMP
jgi:outer membrane cobalamin receptor